MHADSTQNAVHGSDSPASAQREINFFFPHREVGQLSEGTKPRIPQSLEDALCKGLTELAKQKPSQDPNTAILWLGDWLLQHNPTKPLVYGPEELAIDDVDDGADFAPYLTHNLEDPAQASEVSCSRSVKQSAFSVHGQHATMHTQTYASIPGQLCGQSLWILLLAMHSFYMRTPLSHNQCPLQGFQSLHVISFHQRRAPVLVNSRPDNMSK